MTFKLSFFGLLSLGTGFFLLQDSFAKTLDMDDGVNIQAGYFGSPVKGEIPIGWDLMRKFPEIKTVRIEVPPDEGIPLATMQRWIREAAQNGYKIIVTYHRAVDNGSGDPEALLKAARWWKENYATLAVAGPFTVNLMNEWGSHKLSPEAFAKANNDAIAIVRAVYSGPIIIDIPGWGQETYVAAEASKLMSDGAIVLSVHIYGSNFVEYGPHRWMMPEDLVALAKAGRPVLVGEFGGLREGGADWRALVQQAKDLGWTVIAWTWNGDGEGMNMIVPSWDVDCSMKSYYPGTYFGDVYAFLGNAKKPWLYIPLFNGDILLGDWPQSYTFGVHSNASWTVELQGGDDWIDDLSPASGWGEKAVMFTVSRNLSSARRSAVVTVRAGDIVKSFSIHQEPKEKDKH
jgi:mannan endo-1,4-beta-mannosidase